MKPRLSQPSRWAPLRPRRHVLADRERDALDNHGLRRRTFDVRRSLGMTRSGQLALIAAVVLWIVARLIAGTAIYLFAYGCALLLVMSYALGPRRLRLTAERSGLFPRAREGDRLEVEVRLEAHARVGSIILEERLPERLGRPVRLPLAGMTGGSAASHRYGLRCGRRGVYQVGPLVALTGDPLGLSQRETVVAEAFELLVHPRVELVSDRPLTRQLEDAPIRPPVSKPWPSGLEFYGMREYTAGDELRRIVWRASARAGKLMMREAEQGVTDKVKILLDTDRRRHSRDGQRFSESFEMGVRAAASLGVRHLREGYEVTTEANGGPLTRPLRGPASQLSLLDALTRVEPDRRPLSEGIRRLSISAQRDAHNILITPNLGSDDAASLKMLGDRGYSVLVVALIWDEAETPTLRNAAATGCPVVAIRPSQDLPTALYRATAAGVR